ncbi:MAG: S41 family peptidase [Verrucomicrobiota bacterium]|nr:S41 family peptidase [Verrucomicrobiota bacterium]
MLKPCLCFALPLAALYIMPSLTVRAEEVPAQAAQTAPAEAAKANDPKITPLFPIALTHAVPNSHATYEEVRKLILENYYTSDITQEALDWAAIQGMLRYISPPENPTLATIWTAEEYDKILNSLEGVDVSLGLKSSFNAGDGSLTVTEVQPNSPAEGIILPLDRILRVNGQVLKGKTVAEVNALMSGPADTDVVLTINRDIKIVEIKLTRQKYETKNLFVNQISPKLALVELRYFAQDVSKDLEKELTTLKQNGTEAIILDLRNNTGGVFGEALKMSQLFVNERGIVLRTYNQQEKLRNFSSGNKEPFNFKLAILANGNTASASEVLVGALRDQKRAFVIGTKTYGKGVFEKTFELENHFRVKFITGAMFTPTGVSWQGKGLAPDFLVEQDVATVTALHKIDLAQRLKKDIGLITAIKLLNFGSLATETAPENPTPATSGK